MKRSFGHKMFARLYSWGWTLASPLLRRNRRLADGWFRRLVPDDWATDAELWIQAASGGEAYLAAELVRALPPLPDGGIRTILVTTWTRQGLDVLHDFAARQRETRPDLAIQVALFPLDHPARMLRAVRMVRPRLVVLLETELWPGLLSACAQCAVPVAVLNGRMTEGSLRGYQWFGRLVPGFWKSVAPVQIGAVSQVDAARFGSLFAAYRGSPRLEVVANIKFDRVVESVAADASRLIPLLPSTDTHSVLLFASVRKEEEPLLLPVIHAVHQQRPEATLVVAPRHMHRVEVWETLLSSAGFAVSRRSRLSSEHPAEQGSIILWDAFGELVALYALARRIFIGGSLARLGGQNPLEALACGRVPCVGPHTSNFNWALRSSGNNAGLIEAGLVRECPDAASVIAFMTDETLASPPEQIRKRYENWLKSRRGGLQKSVLIVEKCLQSV